MRWWGGISGRNEIKSASATAEVIKGNTSMARNGKLLNDPATYLAGFNRSLVGIDAAVFVVLDNDDRNPAAFRAELEAVALSKVITIDHVFCLAIEEMEAWLLGDEPALLQVYPGAKLAALRSYEQDRICGTWEVLADVVYPGGCKKMRKDHPAYTGKGKIKSEWAQNIGLFMDIHNNQSPSFKYFIGEIERKIPTTICCQQIQKV